MATRRSTLFFFFTTLLLSIIIKTPALTEANWCVARSDASNQALQTALDFACQAGADCTPILSNGLCFLPNTILAHASYAFNSYFQLKGMSTGSCNFSGTATVARTDPSYGSCVYPSSSSTTVGTTTSSTTPRSTSNNPTIPPMTSTPTANDGAAGLNPGLTPPLPTDSSKACSGSTATATLVLITLLLILSFS